LSLEANTHHSNKNYLQFLDNRKFTEQKRELTTEQKYDMADIIT